MKKEHVPVHLRLMPEVAARFRDHIRKRGDVAALILASILETDLENVPLPEVTFVEQKPEKTNYHMPVTVFKRLQAVAAARKCSMNALLNGAIAKYTRRLQLKGKGRSTHDD